jgi:hypothetical protein
VKVKIPIEMIELEDNNYHIVVLSVYDDQSTGYWLIDTGASKTVFDSNLAGRYHLTGESTDQVHTAGISDKPLETTIAHLHGFSIGRLKLDDLRVALLDLSHINQLYAGATGMQICGMLGGDFLVQYQARIDYRKKILELII